MGRIANPLTPTRNAHVTPSDSVDLDEQCMGVRANDAGTLALMGMDGVVCDYDVVAGEVIIGQWKRVMATGTSLTSADLIVFLK